VHFLRLALIVHPERGIPRSDTVDGDTTLR